MSHAVSPVAPPPKDRFQIDEQVDIDGRVAGEILFEIEEARLRSKISLAEKLERFRFRVIDIGAGGETLHAIDDHVGVAQRRLEGERVRWNALERRVQNRRKCFFFDRRPLEASRRATP